MEIINNFGVVKKKHTYLYNNFNETMNDDFRKLKGRFYKKTNHWVFPFVKEESKESNNEKLPVLTLDTSVGVQTDEDDKISTNDSKVEEDDSCSLSSKSSTVQEENTSVGVQTDEDGKISTNDSKVEEDDSCSLSSKSSTVQEENISINVVMDNFSDHLSSVIETNSTSSDMDTLQTQEEIKPKYQLKPATIFYHHVADYF